MKSATQKRSLGQLFRDLSRPVDLTRGTPWKVILTYAGPIMLSYLLQQVYVLTDAIICGQVLTAEEVAGVNDTYPLIFIFLQFAFGCTGGFSVITAKCVGARDETGVRRSFATQILLSLVISAVLTVLSVLALPKLLGIINVTPDNPTVYHAAYDYCLVIFIGILAQMGYNFICGILRAYGDSVTPLVFLILSTALNIGLDLLFLTVLRMGPRGAAEATVLAQLISFLGCGVYTFLRYPDLRPRTEDWKCTWRDVADHLTQGLPMGAQLSILAIGIIIMQGAVVKFDLTETGKMVALTPAQNGFGAASKLIGFLMVFLNGLGTAILGFNAQNFGKCDYERIRKGTKQSLFIMLLISAATLAAALLLMIGGAYQHIFMSADKITEASLRYGNIYLLVDVILYPILGYLIVTRSASQGICKVRYVLEAGIAELIGRTVICAFLPVLVNGGPLSADATLWAFAAVVFGDPGAWALASLVLTVPTVKYLFGMKYDR